MSMLLMLSQEWRFKAHVVWSAKSLQNIDGPGFDSIKATIHSISKSDDEGVAASLAHLPPSTFE
jgi:hypothetical protein